MADALNDRLTKLKSDLVEAKAEDEPDPIWIDMLERNIKRTKAEISPWTCCGQPVETRGLDVYCTVCKRLSR